MSVLKFLAVVPLFIILLLFYNIMAYMGVDLTVGAEPLFSLPLPSEGNLALNWSSIIILIGVFTLYVEIVKSTRTGTITVIEHVLSLGVFIVFLMEFILVKDASNSTFLVLTLMSLLDVAAGFNITIASARRDFTMGS